MFIKKLFIIIITIIMYLSACNLTAFASENVTFTMSDEAIKPGRLVTVQMTAKSNKKLCAATFDFSYDTKLLEYRNAKCPDKTSQISANNTNGKIKAVFLNSYGIDISNGTVIFTLTFKSLAEGCSYIDFNVSDCVDNEVDFIDIGNCKSSAVTVSKNNSSTGSDNDTKSEKSGSKSSGSSNKSKRETTAASDNNSSIDEWGNINTVSDNKFIYLFIGIGLGAAFIATAVLMFFIGKRSFERKNQN